MSRIDGRETHEMRPVEIKPDTFKKNDALISFGGTQVLCYASIEDRVPGWLVGSGYGWLTAEYNMLPSAGNPRQQRERRGASGRTMEIQRLIGRSLRAALDLDALPPLTIHIDCDVIVADGGTRTASITGAMIALANLIAAEKSRFKRNPLKCLVAAISAGIYAGEAVLDLCYTEDRDADVDANIVSLSNGGYAEVQATNEHGVFTREQLSKILEIVDPAIIKLDKLQRENIALGILPD